MRAVIEYRSEIKPLTSRSIGENVKVSRGSMGEATRKGSKEYGQTTWDSKVRF